MTAPVTPPVRTPPKRTPPRKPSHWVRNASIGVIGVFVLLAAIGSAASRQGNITGPTAPPDVVASDEANSSAEASEEVSPTPGETSLLSIKGTGPITSDPFRASGINVGVTYEYTCPADDSFTLNFYGTNGSPLLPDVLVSDFGTTGTDTLTETLSGATGPFTVEVDSPCSWTVEVTGTP
jgi:hypothetical protein